jgi:hypothetical protein
MAAVLRQLLDFPSEPRPNSEVGASVFPNRRSGVPSAARRDLSEPPAQVRE